MDRLLSMLPSDLDYALLVVLRVSGLIFTSPIFGRQNIPRTAKVCFCLTVAYVFIMARPPMVPLQFTGWFSFALMCISELLFGVVLGYVTSLFFMLTFIAGNIIDTQMGFGMVNVYDPQSGAQVPVTGNLYNIIMLLVFYAVGGHRVLIGMLFQTLEYIPVGSAQMTTDAALIVMQSFTKTFTLAIQIAMPFIASGLLIEVAMGVVIRSVPQMNMFVVGIPLKVLVGLIVLVIVMPTYVYFTTTVFTEMYISIDNIFASMRPMP